MLFIGKGVREDLTRDALRAEKFVEKIRQIHLQVQETLKKSQKKYKARHDQRKIENSFKVGDSLVTTKQGKTTES
jgi:hypothetical protein